MSKHTYILSHLMAAIRKGAFLIKKKKKKAAALVWEGARSLSQHKTVE